MLADTGSVILAIDTDQLQSSESVITWTPSLKLQFSGNVPEFDFALWYDRGKHIGTFTYPRLVIGEAKSFGYKSFKPNDIRVLKQFAVKFPGTILVFSTMKEKLDTDEIRRIRQLAEWGRYYTKEGITRAPVIILTGTELFSKFRIEETWGEKGGIHGKFAASNLRIDNLETLAEITQQIYLNMPSIHEWYEKKWKKRIAKKKKVTKKKE